MDGIHAPINTPFDLVNSNDIVNNQTNIDNRPDLSRKKEERELRMKIDRERNQRRGTGV